MGDTHDDPTDHSRTTQPHAGIAMKDNFFWPGLILLVVATIALISTAATAAYRHYEWLSTTVLIAVLGAVAGALWLAHRESPRDPHRCAVGRGAPTQPDASAHSLIADSCLCRESFAGYGVSREPADVRVGLAAGDRHFVRLSSAP